MKKSCTILRAKLRLTKDNESYLKSTQVAVQQKNKCTQIPNCYLLATIPRQGLDS